jgi:multiple sugar transport system substrate-binding protein
MLRPSTNKEMNEHTLRALSRKRFLKLAGGGLAAASLQGVAGCGGGASDEAGEIVLTFGPDESGELPKVIDEYNQKNGTNLTFRQMPSDTGQYFDQILTEFQAGGGNVDIIIGDVIWPAQFAAIGYIEDISERVPESERMEFLPSTIQSNTYKGKLYGVPWYTDAGLLYYRKDLLEGSGITEPPKTWDELKQMAKQVKEDSGTKFGFIFQGAEYEGGVVDGLEYIHSAGGQVLDPDDPSKVVIDSPETVEGLSIERSMLADGVAPLAVANYTETETLATFTNGDAVFCRNWPYMYAVLGDPEQSKVTQDQVGIAPLPVVNEGDSPTSGVGGWGFMINAASENKEEAWKFIEFMISPETERRFAEKATFLPPRLNLYEDEELLDAVPIMALGKEAIRNTEPRPVTPFYQDMSLIMAETFNSSLKGDISPEQAAKDLQEELQNIVDEGRGAT